MADLEHQIPLSDTSVFSLASVSKQFTAFALLLLEEEKELGLEDDSRKCLASLPDYGQVTGLRILASGVRNCWQLLALRSYTIVQIVEAFVSRNTKLDFIQISSFR